MKERTRQLFMKVVNNKDADSFEELLCLPSEELKEIIDKIKHKGE